MLVVAVLLELKPPLLTRGFGAEFDVDDVSLGAADNPMDEKMSSSSAVCFFTRDFFCDKSPDEDLAAVFFESEVTTGKFIFFVCSARSSSMVAESDVVGVSVVEDVNFVIEFDLLVAVLCGIVFVDAVETGALSHESSLSQESWRDTGNDDGVGFIL